jgi:hypothetical protein
MAKGRRRRTPIHSSIKEALGYGATEDDAVVLSDWEERKRRVCKPCWELKYCPYGPLVEQSPTLPTLRAAAVAHNAYLRGALDTGLIGSLEVLIPQESAQYEEWLADEELLLRQAVFELRDKQHIAELEKLDEDEEKLQRFAGGPLPPIHIYRPAFDVPAGNTPVEQDFSPDIWDQIQQSIIRRKELYAKALQTGTIDERKPLDPVRRLLFEKWVGDFNPENHPETIPEEFFEGECNVFGHVCPVFFAAEAFTESAERRRIGRRQLNFVTMMRIVRRDDYRCQHCKKKLIGDEVEFDHIIPVSKGGSSEEHNNRLTCFDCNRDKGDDYQP